MQIPDILSEVTVLNDLREKLYATTQAEVDGATRHLEKMAPLPGESMVAPVFDPIARRLYALGNLLRLRAHLLRAQSAMATSEEMEVALMDDATIADTMSAMALEIFWVQCRVELGFWKGVPIGLRAGWTLVERPQQQGPPGGIMIQVAHGGQPQ